MEQLGRFALAPMSAGDIIDRAVQLYRLHFLVLLRIVLAPSLVSYIGAILLSFGAENFTLIRGELRVVITALLVTIGAFLYLGGKVAFFALLGGMSRSLVANFAWDAPLTAREVYRTVRSRWLGLIGATIVVFTLLVALLSFAYMVLVFALLLFVALTSWLTTALPNAVQVIIYVVFGGAVAVALLAGLLLLYGRIIFVPQVMLVEGKGVMQSIGRSITLAGSDMKRIGAILGFQVYIAWSLLLLLVIPLGWYAYLNGVDINPLGGSKPYWYTIAQQTVTQVSEILLAPIVIVSFTLLYLDVRIRKEGFDVELLANRVLPPATHINLNFDLPGGVDPVAIPDPLAVSGAIPHSDPIAAPDEPVVSDSIEVSDPVPVSDPSIETTSKEAEA